MITNRVGDRSCDVTVTHRCKDCSLKPNRLGQGLKVETAELPQVFGKEKRASA